MTWYDTTVVHKYLFSCWIFGYYKNEPYRRLVWLEAIYCSSDIINHLALYLEAVDQLAFGHEMTALIRDRVIQGIHF